MTPPLLEVHDTLQRCTLFSAEVVAFNLDSRARFETGPVACRRERVGNFKRRCAKGGPGASAWLELRSTINRK
jgi:hypothetical protein